MPKLTFLGTGEAFDPDRTTTSYLIENKGTTMMVDCGYDAPKSLMVLLKNEKSGRSLKNVPDTLLITHWHGDHYGGVPALLMPIWEEVNGIIGSDLRKTERKISIISAHDDVAGRVAGKMQSDYQGFYERFTSEGPIINYKVARIGQTINGMTINFAQTSHGVPNFAYRFEVGDKAFAISGDGALTDESRELFKGVDFLVHEGFNILGSGGKNHASVEEVVNYAVSEGIPDVYIVHVNRQERGKSKEIERLMNFARDGNTNLYLPNDHDYAEI